MNRDVLGCIGSFLDTSSLIVMSSLDSHTADILRNQLELSTKSDELSNTLMNDHNVLSTLKTLQQYILDPKTKQQTAIGRLAIFKFARDVADTYRHGGKDLNLRGEVDIMESPFLLNFIKQELPHLFQDTIKGLLGTNVSGIRRVMFYMEDGITDCTWLASLRGIGLYRLMTAWFQHAENEPRTVKLIQNLPSRSPYPRGPFYISAERLFRELEDGTRATWEEFAKFLDRVEIPSPEANEYWRTESGRIMVQLANQLAKESDEVDDVLFAAMLRYLERGREVYPFKHIYSVIKNSNQPLAKTRAVLDANVSNYIDA